MNHINHNNHHTDHTHQEEPTEEKLATIQYADDDRTPIRQLVEMRLPPLALGFTLGILLPLIVSEFESLLAHDLRIAFFIPFILYMANAVGVQTENIYVRDLRTGKAVFKHYIIKETLAGIMLGLISGISVGLLSYIWFDSNELTKAVAFGMFGAVAIAPVVSLLVVEFFELERTDPAVEAGPIAAVLQDSLSVFIFSMIASSFLL